MLYQEKQVPAQALRASESYARLAMIIPTISGGNQRGWGGSSGVSESPCASTPLSLALERYQTALAKSSTPRIG